MPSNAKILRVRNLLRRVGTAAGTVLPLVCFLYGAAAPKTGHDAKGDAFLEEISIEPASIVISGIGESQTVIVTGRFADGSLRDVTRLAEFSVAPPAPVSSHSLTLHAPLAIEIGKSGVITSKSLGLAQVKVVVSNQTAFASVSVKDSGRTEKLNFAADIAPVFSRVGCNSSNCHGALNGQGGFKLSLFGYDPDADYRAIVKDGNGRRVDLKFPEESLILMKPTFTIRHGGGQLFSEDSLEYRALLNWISAGAPQGKPGGPRLEQILVYPRDQRFLTTAEARQQLVVIGKYTDGREVDITRQVRYHSSDETVAVVSPNGLVSPRRSGEANIMIRSLGAVGVAQVAVVLRPAVENYPRTPRNSYIDDLVFRKLEKLQIIPSDLCTDNEFIRRVYLDLIGTLPTAPEVQRFLNDRSPAKRSRLIDALFRRPEYADFWSLKWGDLLTNSPQFLYNGTAYFQAWLREAFATNRPYDVTVRQLLASSGGTYQALPTNFYAAGKKPEDMVTFTSQAFLGVSLECARCHDHPNERWKRDDFLGMAAFFSQVKFKNGVRNNERFLYIDPDKEFQHPQTKQIVPAKLLGGPQVFFWPQEDRRARLAAWLTSPSNLYFARAAVNRIWREFMGRGIVDPVDDLRFTNPPSNPALLDRLARDFVEHGFDLQHLMKRILNSRTYQLSSKTNDTNRDDSSGYSHYTMRRLTAEQLADAIAQVTAVPEKYPFFYPGKRAIQLPDPIVDSYFLTIFDRATRENATCTRKQTASLAQSLNLVSGEMINAKLRNQGSPLVRLIGQARSDRDIVRYFYLAALGRRPRVQEMELAIQAIAKSNSRREGLEDFAWALLNSKEFLYNH
ncbi:MAG TPA: DUF1553 domain-containing protein [Acidobacteriota bacterium]|jgi:hypothetical protein|nr:DUF1553 domain-containing protein [Acidobacteriota bacterium]